MKKIHLTSLLGIGASLLISMTSANAHFLWGHVTPGTEPTYSLTLSETPVEASDADHLKQARDSSAWQVGGKNLELTNKDNFFVGSLDPKTQIVAAGYSWGVFPNSAKAHKPMYLLDLYAKAAATEAAAAQSANLPVEVYARRAGKQIIATVKSDNKPLANAEVVITTPDNENKEEKSVRADKNGSVRFPYSKPGLYTVRAINVVTPRSGAHNGKRYTEVHAYSTLTFTISQ